MSRILKLEFLIPSRNVAPCQERVGLTFSMRVSFVQADEIKPSHGFFIDTGLAINPRRWPGTSHIPAIWPDELMPHGDVLKPSGQSRVVKVAPSAKNP